MIMYTLTWLIFMHMSLFVYADRHTTSRCALLADQLVSTNTSAPSTSSQSEAPQVRGGAWEWSEVSLVIQAAAQGERGGHDGE